MQCCSVNRDSWTRPSSGDLVEAVRLVLPIPFMRCLIDSDSSHMSLSSLGKL